MLHIEHIDRTCTTAVGLINPQLILTSDARLCLFNNLLSSFSTILSSFSSIIKFLQTVPSYRSSGVQNAIFSGSSL